MNNLRLSTFLKRCNYVMLSISSSTHLHVEVTKGLTNLNINFQKSNLLKLFEEGLLNQRFGEILS